MSRPILSTHVLDTAVGSPAVGVLVELFKQRQDSWIQWHSSATSGDGRVQFPFSKESMAPGMYKLRFDVGTYYKSIGKKTIYHYVEVRPAIITFYLKSLRESSRPCRIPLRIKRFGGTVVCRTVYEWDSIPFYAFPPFPFCIIYNNGLPCKEDIKIIIKRTYTHDNNHRLNDYFSVLKNSTNNIGR